MIPFIRTLRLHPYLRFRISLAHHAMLQFVASLQSSMEIVLLACGPVLLGLLACIALPGLFASTQPWPAAVGLLASQTLIAAAPVLLLRKRLLPLAVVSWSQPLPIGSALRWRADAAVAGMIAAPTALLYAVSCAVWLYQWPDWLRPVAPQALALTLLSLLLAWGLSTLTLARRGRRRRPVPARQAAPPPERYLPRTAGRPAGLLYLWRQLFWRPFWRADNVVGIQQSMLLATALASVALWLFHPPLVPPALWGACASLFVMLLTDRGDKAVAEQIALLRPVASALPLAQQSIYAAAICLGLVPGLTVMLLFAALALGHADGRYSHTVATVWLCFGVLAQVALVGLRKLGPRGRVSLVIGAMLLLTAIGSELWK